ncbi:TPA: hypothetical protein N0F65_008025 [Lagenidium giganteum]|uniref:Uncharacterized protein n=1 Tax=Lagenidium giganteum TaxID=4803 RepID=A0AAV2YN37_9STRA|nr:TPA: hypothetical protein N0F65_008025 [Lagenidium giganteum]
MQNLSNLVGLKLDNVTLVEWEEDAALTNTHHPKLLFLFLVRFNATDIPPGMLSTDFPKLLYDIEICISSLSGLPSDLPSVWPAHMWLYVDHANWTAIPEVMLEMELEFLHLSYNQIHEVPDALFTNPTLTLIALSGNPISALPKVLTKPATEYHLLFLDSTKISELPSWLHANATKVLAGETPFCDTPEHEEMETIKGLRLCSVDIDCRDLHLGSS